MTITVQAVYENGILRPVEPLPLQEHETVLITVESQGSLILQARGLIGWKGDHAALEPFAIAPELDPQDGP